MKESGETKLQLWKVTFFRIRLVLPLICKWICNIRGPEFTQDRCGLYTDNDFIEAGHFWTKNQDFIFNIVQEWEIPKLIIKNEKYNWEDYENKVNHFLEKFEEDIDIR